MFKNYAIFKNTTTSHIEQSLPPTSLLLLRTVQKEFWSVYLKVVGFNFAGVVLHSVILQCSLCIGPTCTDLKITLGLIL